MATLQGQQGAASKQTGFVANVGFGEFGDMLTTEIMPRYYENTYRGFKFTATTAGGGLQLAATHLFSTAIATFTPILAIYNPLTSGKNIVLDHIYAGLSAAPLATVTQTGAFLLVAGAGQSITNAQTATPVSLSTLKATGSVATGVTNAALVGAVGNSTLLRPIAGPLALVTTTANAGGILSPLPIEEVAGALIVPPGGYLAIANGISNAVAGHLVSAAFVWDEVPV